MDDLERKKYLESLYNIAKKQEKSLSNKNVELFGVLGNDRKIIIEKLKVLNKELVKGLNAEEKSILIKLNELDKQNNIELQRQFSKVKEQIRQLNSHNNMVKSYINPYSSLTGGTKFEK